MKKPLSKTTIQNHCKKLRAINPELGKLFDEIGTIDFVPKQRPLYEALIRSITSQMISTRAATTIVGKLAAFCGGVPIAPYSPEHPHSFPTLDQLSDLSHDDLRSIGYSNNKSLAIREIVQKSLGGELPTVTELETMSDDDIIRILVPLRGIGQWTVEMLLIFTLGRTDVWPVDDFGVREGYRLWTGDTEQLKPKQLRDWAEPYHPYHTTLALYFWKWADRNKK
jgi:DNA-3-methyladenine glycosylase II